MSQVELVEVSKNYGGHFALHDVSVSFGHQKITAIIGRSGSGKSTLLKTINGLVKPSSGKVVAPDRKQIGYVVQGSGLFPHLTVAENISLPGKIVGKEESSRATDLLNLTELPLSYSNKYPWQLSGGEQQRVALCRALFLNPPVLLLDEPFGSLDTYTRRDLQGKILELRTTFKLTMIIVTHDIPEAVHLADDILVLERGRVQKFGPAKDISL
jgi:osmoprotectant transport system ATP-binding protein